MNKLLAIILFLMPSWALAAAKEMESAADAPAELVDMVYVVIFGILFIGLIVGYCVHVWWADRKSKKAGK